MGIISKFFSIFQHKEVNKITGAENSPAHDNASPLVMEANVTTEINADNFEEEIDVLEAEEEVYVSDTEDVTGVTVDEGDDMTPIIMDENEKIVDKADLSKVINDPNNKSEVIEYPINIRAEDNIDEDDVEIL